MHIVHITTHFLPSAGGVQWSVFRTAEAQAGHGHEVTIITETPGGKWDDTSVPFRVVRFRVPRIRPFTRLLYWRWMWRNRVVYASADILHFHDYTPCIHWFLPLRMLIRRPCFVITFHGYERWPIRLRHRLLRALAASLCHHRFAVGEYVRQIYRHPVDDVYLGAPVHRLDRHETTSRVMTAQGATMRDTTRQSMERGAAVPRFVYAGRLEPDSEILPIVRAIARASADCNTPVEIDLAGDGSLRPHIETLAHPQCVIRIHGMLTDPLPVIQSGRYVIATGFLGILEAFQTGRPVIVPAMNTLRELYVRSIPDAESMLTIIRSEDDAVRIFQDLLTGRHPGEWRERTARAEQFVSQLTWDDIALMMEARYRAVIEKHRTPRTAPERCG
ncbi:MAG: glycosyltransferase family 4 protein [Bacteroidetes bacterium]|nr:glycosyltransferase family 4 protein [Bacteroidota bacterium]